MNRLKINDQKTGFIKDGKHFFYLADTVWSAFTNATLDEWEYYLEKRWSQGFTVLQINTLPQWDRCLSDVGMYPFDTADGQKFVFGNFQEDYFERASVMCKMAVEKGFQLALVVLWLNYVPGTWASKFSDCNIMPKEFVEPFTEKIVEVFEQFQPIYIVSGDTDFDTPEAVDYYEKALQTLERTAPDALKTVHIKRGYDYIPPQYLDRLDFCMFQSGHNCSEQDMAYLLPERMQTKYPGKPLLNAEPCYEQMGYSRQQYGRFTPFDLRKAAWSSLLAGASAGVTYGAHGVWNWKKENRPVNQILGEGFDEAFPVQTAIEFQGAWDYGFIREFLDMNQITSVTGAQELLLDCAPDIRMGKCDTGIYLIYVPKSTRITLGINPKGLTCKALDLTTRYVSHVRVTAQGHQTKLHLHCFQNDVLLIVTKERRK